MSEKALLIKFNIDTGLIVDGVEQFGNIMAMSVGKFCTMLTEELGVEAPVTATEHVIS